MDLKLFPGDVIQEICKNMDISTIGNLHTSFSHNLDEESVFVVPMIPDKHFDNSVNGCLLHFALKRGVSNPGVCLAGSITYDTLHYTARFERSCSAHTHTHTHTNTQHTHTNTLSHTHTQTHTQTHTHHTHKHTQLKEGILISYTQ